jgi:hypothetical protein
MDKLFFWNPYHSGDIIFTRPLVRAVLDRHDVEITWGCFQNHKYLIEDLPVAIAIDPRDDSLAQSLVYMCPFDHHPINTWIGQYPQTRRCCWASVVGAYNRQVEARGLSQLKITSRTVQLPDLPDVDVVVTDPAVYVANGKSRSGQSAFQFDMQALAQEFPAITFYCIADPGCAAANVISCTKMNLIQLAAISTRCRAIIGKPGGAIDCTLTESNRTKPRAIMGPCDPWNPTIWEYPGMAISYLRTNDELSDFLRQALAKPRIDLRK